MKIGTKLLIALTILVPSLSAAAVQDIEALRQKVKDHAVAHYARKGVAGELKIHVGRLDSRLRLAQCDKNLTFRVQEPAQLTRNISVKTMCRGYRNWTIYVPVTLELFDEVVVASRPMQRGEIVSETDLSLRIVNVLEHNRHYANSIAEVRGLEVKRPLRAGEILSVTKLQKPDIVLKGQLVTLSTRSRFLAVEAAGIALGDGHLGERIRVRNRRSNRIVEAEVVAPGKVSVAAR